MFMMSLIILITAPVAFNASTPQRLTPYLVMLIVFIAACTMIGTVLGVFVRSHSKLTMLSQLIFLPSVMLLGIMFPVNMLPKTLEYIEKIFPATWGYLNMCNNSFEASSLVPLVLIFAIAAAICIWKIKHINKL